MPRTYKPVAMKAAEARAKVQELQAELEKYKSMAYCYMCDTHKAKDKFYKSTNPRIKSGITPICKNCARKLAYRVGKDLVELEPTKESVQLALQYLDKPFFERLWDASIQESEAEFTGKAKDNVWTAYIKNVSLPNYTGMTYEDGDNIVNPTQHMVREESKETKQMLSEQNEELFLQYKRNRKDVIQVIGYDPFEHYPIEMDKPVLYAQLNSFIDEETKSDGMKLGAVIQIVKKLNQAEKLNDQIDAFINNPITVAENMATIDKLTGASQKLINVANAMAKDNGISVNFNNNKSRGANTLSGKIKKLSEIGLREAKINTFDIGTCEGMRQVAEINQAARRNQIGYDESIAQEIKDIKVELVETLTKERDAAKESARKLLVENQDLKDFLLAKGLVDENYRVIED